MNIYRNKENDAIISTDSTVLGNWELINDKKPVKKTTKQTDTE